MIRLIYLFNFSFTFNFILYNNLALYCLILRIEFVLNYLKIKKIQN